MVLPQPGTVILVVVTAMDGPDGIGALGAAGQREIFPLTLSAEVDVTQPARDRGSRRSLSPGLMVVVAVCLVAPFVALCWVGSYAKVEPTLAGFPFFFWYQLLWVFLTAGLTSVAYLILESRHRSNAGGSSGGTGDANTTGGSGKGASR